jgi:hypothetical protein
MIDAFIYPPYASEHHAPGLTRIRAVCGGKTVKPEAPMLAPWQIREFPTDLRERLTKRAKDEGMSVGEFLTRILMAAEAAGWPMAFVGTSNGKTLVKPEPGDDTALWVTLACQVAAAPRQRSAVVQAAAKAVRLRLSATTLLRPTCS